MIKREAKLQTKFNKWLREEWKQTGVFELKQTRTKSIAFSAVKWHQERALWISKHGTFAFKISDLDMGFKPYDCFCVANVPAFVVIFFGNNKYLIDIDTWLREQKISKRKSLTEDRAKEIAINIP